ncbi:hypothetical protein N9933_01115 [bacterium]|nr:hypothetical protein [bacterium]
MKFGPTTKLGEYLKSLGLKRIIVNSHKIYFKFLNGISLRIDTRDHDITFLSRNGYPFHSTPTLDHQVVLDVMAYKNKKDFTQLYNRYGYPVDLKSALWKNT